MSLHTEINFEAEICKHLAAHGWLYSVSPDTQNIQPMKSLNTRVMPVKIPVARELPPD